MAKIFLEHRRSRTWMWLLIAAVVAICVGWLLSSRGRHEVSSAAGEVGEAIPGGAPIADLRTVLVPNRAPLVGRHVALASAAVQSVASAQAFWIGNGNAPDQRLLVVRSDVAPANDSATSRSAADSSAAHASLAAGQRVAVWGRLEEVPINLTQAATDWKIAASDTAALRSGHVYLAADSVRAAPR